MCRQSQQVMLFTPDTDLLEAFLVVGDGTERIALPVCNEQGTFLARSPNKRARVVAALTAMHFERGRVHVS